MSKREVDYKEFSGVGDSFVNLIYSLAVFKVEGKPVGKRVSNHILSEALRKAGLRDTAGVRMDKHDLADYVEGLIFCAWDNKKISIEECVAILAEELKNSGLPTKKASIDAFAVLLGSVAKKL